MQWLSQTLLASLYPGGSYERKYMAIVLLNALLEVWKAPDAGCKSYTKPSSQQGVSAADGSGAALVAQGRPFRAFCHGFFGPQTTHLLLGMGPGGVSVRTVISSNTLLITW